MMDGTATKLSPPIAQAFTSYAFRFVAVFGQFPENATILQVRSFQRAGIAGIDTLLIVVSHISHGRTVYISPDPQMLFRTWRQFVGYR
jgi:hypothetical protein